MELFLGFLLCAMAFLLSYGLTGLTRHVAIRKAIFDIPNERSSHCIPTPRGGGIAIVLVFYAMLLWLVYRHALDLSLFFALLCGMPIALIGYLDDMHSLSAKYRFLVHGLSAAAALFCMGYTVILPVDFFPFSLPVIQYIIGFLGIVWCINFYNFMDGIDGLAGTEGIFVSLSSSLALWMLGMPNLSLIMGVFAAAIAGFTVWNLPPAKIFMGDVGSGFLGFTFAVFGLYTANQHLLSISFWWLLLAIFIFDATLTLGYRILQRKKWYQAHREHAYQTLILLGANHKKVTSSIFLINTLILLPSAFIVLYWPSYTLMFVGAVAAIFLFLWVWIKSKPISI